MKTIYVLLDRNNQEPYDVYLKSEANDLPDAGEREGELVELSVTDETYLLMLMVKRLTAGCGVLG